HDLLERMNSFIKDAKERELPAKIHERYYGKADFFDSVDLEAYHERLETRFPEYIALTRKHADRCGFDWRLIAAQMYQESHFNPKARSSAGAHGLMQLMRGTAKRQGVTDILDPEQNIKAGVSHLKYLYDFFKDVKEPDRMQIALAAYNAGQGHIEDAQIIAKEMGLDHNNWDSLSLVLPLLSNRRYYTKTA
ncbi:MAG: transglycosylase SLT domain-containing protein, partial [bacterium]|nr:transglycosylase SLT domain-containing protein [bacterium]